MTLEAYRGIGTLSTAQTVILDHPSTLPLGRVRVVVEVLPGEPANHTWLGILADIHRELQQNSHCPRSRAEVDVQLQAERDSWDVD